MVFFCRFLFFSCLFFFVACSTQLKRVNNKIKEMMVLFYSAADVLLPLFCFLDMQIACTFATPARSERELVNICMLFMFIIFVLLL